MPTTASRDGPVTPQAFEVLYRDAWPAVVDYLRFRIGAADAEDVAADAFVSAWAARSQYDSARGTAAARLWGIVRNAARASQRTRRGPTVPLTGAEAAAGPELVDRAARAETWARVESALARLKPVDREIIALRFGAGFSHRAIGEALGLTEMATAARLHRAVRRLRATFEGGADW